MILVHNPTAGDEDHGATALKGAIEAHGHEVVYVSTKDDSWAQALDAPVDLVAAAGGDGTVRTVFEAAAGRQLPVTLLPLGTANNIARSLGFESSEPEALIAGWTHGAVRRYDVGRAEAPWGEATFFESVGGGLLAELLRVAAEPSGTTKIVHGRRLLDELLEFPTFARWSLELDGRSVSGDYAAVEVLNTPWTGPALPLAPNADPGDGTLDVVLLGPVEVQALAAYVAGGPLPELDSRRAERVRIVAERAALVRVDDELWPAQAEAPAGAPLTTYVAGQLDVLVPRAR